MVLLLAVFEANAYPELARLLYNILPAKLLLIEAVGALTTVLCSAAFALFTAAFLAVHKFAGVLIASVIRTRLHAHHTVA